MDPATHKVESSPADAETQAAAKQLGDFIARSLARGASEKQITKELVKHGMGEDDAREAIAHAREAIAHVRVAIDEFKKTPQGRAAMRAKFLRHIVFGLLWCVGGTIVTVATYSSAWHGGGTYVVAWGAILFGGLELLYGLGGYLFAAK